MLELLLLGLVVGSNNAAVALALGALGQKCRRWRIVLLFGSFEFAIPLVGMWLGRQIAARLAGDIDWAGPAVLVALGLWSFVSAVRSGAPRARLMKLLTSWSGLLLLAFTLSLDNLAVGIGLGLGQRGAPLLIATTIAVFSATFTWLGIQVGDEAKRHWERYAGAGAGVLLVVLGVALWQSWL